MVELPFPEAGSSLRFIDFLYHSTLSLRVIQQKKNLPFSGLGNLPKPPPLPRARFSFKVEGSG